MVDIDNPKASPIVVLPFFDEESIANEPDFTHHAGSDEEVNLLRNMEHRGKSFRSKHESRGSFGPNEGPDPDTAVLNFGRKHVPTLGTAKSHHEVISKPKNERLQDDYQLKARKTESWNYDSGQSLKAYSLSDWSANQAERRSEKMPNQSQILGNLVAKYDFQSDKESDLRFKAGDEILVLRVRKNDWWVGQCNGRQGLFPTNYVKKSA
jgi:hypothetical protein